jgi:L-lactate dehydrogenase (cytochrome)
MVIVLRDEIETTMRLLGVTNVSQLGPHLLNTKALDGKIMTEIQWGPTEGPGSGRP